MDLAAGDLTRCLIEGYRIDADTTGAERSVGRLGALGHRLPLRLRLWEVERVGETAVELMRSCQSSQVPRYPVGIKPAVRHAQSATTCALCFDGRREHR